MFVVGVSPALNRRKSARKLFLGRRFFYCKWYAVAAAVAAGGG